MSLINDVVSSFATDFTDHAARHFHVLTDYCVKYGTFDEKNIGRDRTPDKSVNHLAKGILAYMFVRTGFTFYLHYYQETFPLTSFTWTYPLRLAAWEITLDYFFVRLPPFPRFGRVADVSLASQYVYHRASHEVDALWFIHQHHHTTKHPTAILA